MISGMSDCTNQGKIADGDVFTISCDACVMQATSACGDCVVTFLLDEGAARERAPAGAFIDLDHEQARVVQLFGRAGMVPRLRHVAS
jgi:hypothetical protein